MAQVNYDKSAIYKSTDIIIETLDECKFIMLGFIMNYKMLHLERTMF